MLLEQFLTTLAQAYGGDSYGAETYACQPGVTSCTTQDVSAPNTGFFATPDAALSTAAGALLVTIGLAGIVYVIVSRLKRNKNKQK